MPFRINHIPTPNYHDAIFGIQDVNNQINIYRDLITQPNIDTDICMDIIINYQFIQYFNIVSQFRKGILSIIVPTVSHQKTVNGINNRIKDYLKTYFNTYNQFIGGKERHQPKIYDQIKRYLVTIHMRLGINDWEHDIAAFASIAQHAPYVIQVMANATEYIPDIIYDTRKEPTVTSMYEYMQRRHYTFEISAAQQLQIDYWTYLWSTVSQTQVTAINELFKWYHEYMNTSHTKAGQQGQTEILKILLTKYQEHDTKNVLYAKIYAPGSPFKNARP